MKLAFQLAYKNLMGAGLRTWLTAGILSFAFITILFINGLIDGWNQQAVEDTINWEIGQGQLQNENFDAFNPFSIESGHGNLHNANNKNLTPVLIRQASIYPQHRMITALLKGIDENQTVLKLPTQLFKQSAAQIPALIGKRMAESTMLKTGDEVLVRWRDKNGSFDAAQITIAGIFSTNVPSVDGGQIWIPIKKLWNMTGLTGEATLYIAGNNYQNKTYKGWSFKNHDFLLKDLNDTLAAERMTDSTLYIFLLAIALLAIFDTQVLSVFRRQKEIGTYIALGMTRSQVVRLFTIEGTMNSIFAVILGCVYGTPLLIYFAKTGISIPNASGDMGITIADTITPIFGVGLIIGTMALVIISSTIVSFLPSRKIANMNPVNALKGKIQ